MRWRMFFVLFAVVLTLSGVTVLAAVPSLINLQGILKDSGDNPLPDATYAVTFRIYDADAGGSVIWSEVSSVTTANGLFTVNLGSVIPVPDTVFNNPDRWLEIQVQGFEAMSPRTRLTSVAYANQAAQWNSAGPNLSRMNGNVGIGTTNPEAKLHIGGGGFASILLDNSGDLFWKNTAGIPKTVLTTHDDDNVYLDAIGASSSDLIFRTNTTLTERMRISHDGTVGIGITPVPSLQITVSTARSAAVYGVGTAPNSIGLWGVANTGSGAYAVYGQGSEGYSGYFGGRVHVQGTLTKPAGSFKIDHPLDPANRYLSHSFVESPDMMNIYNGVVVTDAEGAATVIMPDWFEALNRDFRYQLTVIGQFAQAIVSDEIAGNQFSIKTDKPNVKVSWQVTGIRQDAYANSHRILVEERKPDNERGFYMHPELFSQPEEKQIEWARRPEIMKQMKEKREKAQAEGEK